MYRLDEAAEAWKITDCTDIFNFSGEVTPELWTFYVPERFKPDKELEQIPKAKRAQKQSISDKGMLYT